VPCCHYSIPVFCVVAMILSAFSSNFISHFVITGARLHELSSHSISLHPVTSVTNMYVVRLIFLYLMPVFYILFIHTYIYIYIYIYMNLQNGCFFAFLHEHVSDGESVICTSVVQIHSSCHSLCKLLFHHLQMMWNRSPSYVAFLC
jgi:hypothetical protein